MKNRLYLFLLFICVAVSASAQRAGFEISFKSTVAADLSKVYVQPLGNATASKVVPLRLKDNVYSAKVPVSVSGFYEVVMVINGGQWLTTVYSSKAKRVKLDIEFDGVALKETSSVDNRSMSELNSIVYASRRKLWMNEGLSNAALRSLFEGYMTACDSIIKVNNPSPRVAKYMRASAYANAKNFYSSIPGAQKRKQKDIPFTEADVLPSMSEVLDNECAALVPSAMQSVCAAVTADTKLDTRGMLDVLYGGYKCAAVRVCVADMLLNRFLARYNYAMDFNGGLKYLQAIVKDFDLSGSYVEEYLKRKSALVGADFPKEVVLVNPEGAVVDFSKFKGKYVYVDLWASWCGPCCREVPYLQALEKELEGGNVVFVSISTDADSDSWKAKLKELNMHGNQLHDRDGSLGKALNVGGIPFFVIYDKEGKLHTYGAQRPSTGEPLKQFLRGLK
ncbi:MAG: TlpA family protein disulfide reductase [Bacteroidaceae bacterium]|nr:TlpA family protein disulfide reductase [Bacteroidaceae bacterium]